MRLRATASVLIFGLALVGCAEGPGAPSVAAGFAPSGTPAASDRVRLTGGPAAHDLVTVNVAIGGPTSSDDLYSFAFDLVLSDPDLVELVEGSEVFGDALRLSGSQQYVVMARRNADRIVVGVTKWGGGPGNGIDAGEALVVALRLRVLRPGSTSIAFNHAPPAEPAALDSVTSPIEEIEFDTASAAITGS